MPSDWESGKYRMRYLLNLPLAVAALLQVWFASLVFMSAPWSGWSDGPSRGAMVLVMLEPVALAWILLLPVIADPSSPMHSTGCPSAGGGCSWHWCSARPF